MNEDFLITDPRPSECFRDKTFSGYKKTEVLKTLFKSIDMGKVEDTCFWLIECIVSGYSVDLSEKMAIYGSKVVHVNNPRWPSFMWRRYHSLHASIDHITRKEKDKLIHIRNSSHIRNNLVDVAVTLAISSKTKRYDKLPKVDPSKDFEFTEIQKKMNATMQLLPKDTIRFTDPEELRIIMNELFFNLKNTHGGYEKCSYWIGWLVQWEKKEKAQKRKFEIETRSVPNVNPKYGKDMIWLVWEVIFEEAKLRDVLTKKQVQSLFHLFSHNYTCGKRHSRLSYIYHAIGYLTLPFKDRPLRPNHELYIRSQFHIHTLIKSKKTHQVKSYTPPPEKPQKSKGIEKEIIESRMKELQDIELLNY
jgi:hypothetical protein